MSLPCLQGIRGVCKLSPGVLLSGPPSQNAGQGGKKKGGTRVYKLEHQYTVNPLKVEHVYTRMLS